MKKCVECGRVVKHMIIDWAKHYVWCKRCWKGYLKDFRSTAVKSSNKKR